MIFPTIHLNGTSAESLYEGYEKAAQKLREAREALGDTYPNGRDYYPQGEAALAKAQAEHSARLAQIEAVRQEVEDLLAHIAYISGDGVRPNAAKGPDFADAFIPGKGVLNHMESDEGTRVFAQRLSALMNDAEKFNVSIPDVGIAFLRIGSGMCAIGGVEVDAVSQTVATGYGSMNARRAKREASVKGTV